MTTPYAVSTNIGSVSYNSYVNAPITGPLSTNQTPCQITYHSYGILNDSNAPLRFLAQLNASNPSTSNEMRKNFGLNLSQISCTYNYTDCKNDLHWYWSFAYGNCYQFNSGLNLTNQNVDLKETFRNGKDFGFRNTR